MNRQQCIDKALPTLLGLAFAAKDGSRKALPVSGPVEVVHETDGDYIRLTARHYNPKTSKNELRSILVPV